MRLLDNVVLDNVEIHHFFTLNGLTRMKAFVIHKKKYSQIYTGRKMKSLLANQYKTIILSYVDFKNKACTVSFSP